MAGKGWGHRAAETDSRSIDLKAMHCHLEMMLRRHHHQTTDLAGHLL
jgi:hypothetical protein